MTFNPNPKVLLSLASIGVAGALIVGATFAFFSDTETSTGNLLQAGKLDLKIDNTSYYNGVLNAGTTWTSSDLTNQVFFNFNDLKPGDLGEDTISLHLDDNNAWLCADIDITANEDNGITEPEDEVDGIPANNSDGTVNGDLSQALNFIFWNDDGDNVLEIGENILTQGPASAVLGGVTYPLADSQANNLGGIVGQPATGGADYFIGKAFCFGTLTPDPQEQGAGNPTVNAGVKCNGTLVDNIAQSDKLTGDISFRAVQSRNNPSFVCQRPVGN